jgi:hypothetical protein
MRLGNKLKSTIAAREVAARVAEEEKRRRADEKNLRERAKILEWLRDWKTDVIHIIETGYEPSPVKIPRYVNDYSTGSIGNIKHPHHDLILPFREWATAEGLELRITDNCDGVGMESWWEISVRSAT